MNEQSHIKVFFEQNLMSKLMSDFVFSFIRVRKKPLTKGFLKVAGVGFGSTPINEGGGMLAFKHRGR